jgi:hypothetical protein
MVKQGLLAVVLFSFASTVFAAEAGFEGTYKCKGYDPYANKAYQGTIIVTHKNAVYQLTMDYDSGEKAIGTGGQYDPTLMSVVFQDKENLKHIGLEQYTFTPDRKKIQGYWVYLGEDKLGSEVCDRV